MRVTMEHKEYGKCIERVKILKPLLKESRHQVKGGRMLWNDIAREQLH